jgi:hypothetical protein
MSQTRGIIHSANSKIQEIRSSIMIEIGKLAPDMPHIFNPDTSGLCVNDEEEGVRLQVISVNQDEVTLEDDSTMSLGSIGTDDLLTILDTLEAELNPE